jgi:crossover junction endodeoxyribonuclease RuvC
VIAGIDPGIHGAIAIFHRGALVELHDMPVADSRVDGAQVAEILRDLVPDTVVLEDTQPMPKNGSIASFKLGLNTGIVIGAIHTLGYPLVRIRPVDWKRANGLIGKSKDASRYLARELWPSHADDFKLAKNDGRAEAALIARAHIIRTVKEAAS